MKDKTGNTERILLHHGSGGSLMHDLIRKVFIRAFRNPVLAGMTDSAVLPPTGKNLAFTTDSFVVDPVFFPGGDIGKLAVCGTVNDLSVSGAKPVYLTAAFILEEGFPVKELERIVSSMAKEARKAGVTIVTGDTKVVPKGKCDKIFINTAGIGILENSRVNISSGKNIRPGDKILINGTIGDHGMAILHARESLPFISGLKSDCTSLNRLIGNILEASNEIRFMRDPTRGGLATVLCEIAEKTKLGIVVSESALKVKREVRGISELLGFDPMHLANEGKVVVVVSARDAGKVLEAMKRSPEGKSSSVIAEVVLTNKNKVVMETVSGGRRYVEKLAGDQLPRIC